MIVKPTCIKKKKCWGRSSVDNIAIQTYRKSSQHNSDWCEGANVADTDFKKFVTKSKLKKWISKAVKNSFVVLGNGILQQTRGVPMGMNPAPYLSELYLFMYELEFMEQLITRDDEHRELFRKYFSAVCRYQDDKFSAW